MLDVLIVIWLCKKNKMNALIRGRKPTGFIVLTICLWIVFLFIGVFVGMAVWSDYYSGEFIALLIGYLFAALGGLISYLITKNCTPGDFISSQPQQHWNTYMVQNLHPLSSPSQITLVREDCMDGPQMRWDFMLNGQLIGSLDNGQYKSVPTMQRCNVIIAKDANGVEIPPFMFNVADSSHVEIHFKYNQFIAITGVLPSTIGPSVQQQAYPQPVSPYPAQPQNPICVTCGAQQDEDAIFCHNCGTRL